MSPATVDMELYHTVARYAAVVGQGLVVLAVLTWGAGHLLTWWLKRRG